MSELNLDQTTITELQAIARKHIETAESNPDCNDLFDYWDCYTLENGDLIDYNNRKLTKNNLTNGVCVRMAWINQPKIVNTN